MAKKTPEIPQSSEKPGLQEVRIKNLLAQLTAEALNTNSEACSHLHTDSDFYGSTCRNCKTILAGYGYEKQQITCTHNRYENDYEAAQIICTYCGAIKE